MSYRQGATSVGMNPRADHFGDVAITSCGTGTRLEEATEETGSLPQMLESRCEAQKSVGRCLLLVDSLAEYGSDL